MASYASGMALSYVKKLLSLCLLAVCLSGCIVSHRVARPRGCRNAVWVDSRRGGYWQCDTRRHHHHHHHRPRGVIIVR